MTQRSPVISKIVVSEGNLKNSYINLRDSIDIFPTETFGGSNKSTASDVKIWVEWGGATPTLTDIDGSKKMFRKRDWVREFFDRNLVRVGDIVAIERTGDLQYRVSVEREAGPLT